MKKFKSIISVALIVAMAASLSACAKVKEYTADDFEDALKDAGIKKGDIDTDHSKEYDVVRVYDDDYSITFYEYDDEEDAYRNFRDYYHTMYEDTKEDGYFEGTLKGSKSKSKGYILFDGEYDDGDDYEWEGYGGIYFSGKSFCIIRTDSTKDKKVEKVKDILDELGYAKP